MDESRIIDETDDSVLDDEYASNITEPNERQIGGIGIACSNDKTSSTVEKYVDVTMTPNHFDLVCCIGEGAFGKVLLVRPRLESTVTSRKNVYAMKVISKKLLKKKNHFSYMKAERDIMTKIQHPFVVNLKFAFQTENKVFLIMDFLSGGELFFHLQKRGVLREHEARFYMAEMILALEYLHSQNIVHRDLKPENILLSKHGHIGITDFGLAKETSSDGDESLKTLCGTGEYMAPEMILRCGYGKAADWWSFGALVYEMLVGHPPFRDSNSKELDRKILSEKLTLPGHLTSKAHSILKGLLNRDVTKRLGCGKTTMFQIGGVRQLKNDPFFRGLDFEDVYRLNAGIPPLHAEMLKKREDDMLASMRSVSTSPMPGNGSGKQSNPPETEELISKSTIVTRPTPKIGLPPCGGISRPQSAVPSHLHSIDAEFDLSCFHNDFIGKTISPSILDDSVPPTMATSPIRTRTPSACDIEAQKQKLSDDCFVGFEYVDPEFACTEQQVDDFNEILRIKLAKESKKRSLREKKENERLLKQKAEVEAKAKEELRLRIIAEEQEQKRKAEVERLAREEAYAIQRLENEKLSIAYNKYLEELAPVQKKVKGLKKKLREIEDLEVKLCETHLQLTEEARSTKLETENSVEIKGGTKSKKAIGNTKAKKTNAKASAATPAVPKKVMVTLYYTPENVSQRQSDAVQESNSESKSDLNASNSADPGAGTDTRPKELIVEVSKEQAEKLGRKAEVMLELSDFLSKELELVDNAPPAPVEVDPPIDTGVNTSTPQYYTALSSPVPTSPSKTSSNGVRTDVNTHLNANVTHDPKKISPVAKVQLQNPSANSNSVSDVDRSATKPANAWDQSTTIDSSSETIVLNPWKQATPPISHLETSTIPKESIQKPAEVQKPMVPVADAWETVSTKKKKKK